MAEDNGKTTNKNTDSDTESKRSASSDENTPEVSNNLGSTDAQQQQQNDIYEGLPTEDQIEEEANSRTGILSYFRVAKAEYTKFFLLGGMFGVIGFIYSFMRILKDMFVMVKQEPTTILFIKIVYILPVSMFLVFLIQYMLATKTVSRIFTIFCVAFAMLFISYAIILLAEDFLMPSRHLFRDYFADDKMKVKGLNVFKSLILTVNEPLATIIFITAEMWGSLLLSYLFLSFLNESCTVKQFARFIPALYIITNLALLMSANVTGVFFWIRKGLNYRQNQLFLSGIFLIQAALTASIIMMKYYLEKVVMKKPIFIPTSIAIKNKKKVSVSFTEGIETMCQSKLLLALSGIVLFYNMSYNILESTYKMGVKVAAESLGKEKGAYSGKFNQIDQYLTSITVITLNLSSFSTFIETRGYLLVILITPIITFMALIFTLGAAIYNTSMEDSAIKYVSKMIPGGDPVYILENYSGILFLSLLKIAKYSAFDICKERLGMRINPTYRARFKSVYDGIFGKLGKSLGSIYGLVMFGILSTDDLRKAAPITGILIFLFFLAWIKAGTYLSNMYNKSISNNTDIDIDMFNKNEVNKEQENVKKENVVN